MNEVNITLNEISFTNACKNGFIKYYDNDNGSNTVYLSKIDMSKLMNGEYITKDIGIKLNIRVINVSSDTLKEIVKRSPIFSDLYLASQ